MAPPKRTSTTRLPRELLDKLQASSTGTDPKGRKHRKAPARKERRKDERLHKKQAKRQKLEFEHGSGKSNRRLDLPWSDDDELSEGDFERDDTPEPAPSKNLKPIEQVPKEPPLASVSQPKKSILKKPKPEIVEEDKKYIRKAIKDKLAEDDAEIAALEKKLKISDKKLPNAFIEDGLDFLLEGLDSLDESRSFKRKRTKLPEPMPDSEETNGDETTSDDGMNLGEDRLDNDVSGDESHLDSENSEDDQEFAGFSDGSGGGDQDSDGKDSDGDGDDGGEDKSGDKHDKAKKSNDQNELDIYGRPKNGPTLAVGKYIPPSLRKPASEEDEQLTRIRRQIQGQINRLSEPTLLGIINEMEQLYRSNPRHHVTSILTDILIASVCDRSVLLDTFMILHAGFIAALYKIIGIDFGAHVIQRVVGEFDKSYEENKSKEVQSAGKECANMVSLLSELYNFQVVGCNLMFDFVRMFLVDITELNTELLLKLIRNCGPQLRSENPTALKDLVVMMQTSVTKAGEVNLSVRTKFMIETVTNLKNNRLKSATANRVVLVESTQRMKKLLGSLNKRHLRASEPLQVSLEDIRNVETKGKWWLVGASWRENMAGDFTPAPETEKIAVKKDQEDENDTLHSIDYLQLARQQGMNTDVRRTIFVTIMSSEDYKDACERLLRLRLKKVQQREIPRVVLHCCASEATYNHYYTLIARHLCSQHHLKMAFQFSLWSFFKQMGEDDGNDSPLDEDEGEEVPMRKIVSLGKFYGSLVGEGALSLHILKILNFAYLQPRTKVFLEVFFISLLLKSQPRYRNGQKTERSIIEIFLAVNDNPVLMRGLQDFLKKYVKNSDVAGGETETEVVKWGVRVAVDALKTAAVAQATG